MVYGIPSFKLEKKIVEAEIDVLRELGVDIRCGVEVGKDVTIEGLKKEGYKAFYVAIGCQGSRKANIPGEDAEGVMSAVDFLREVGGAITEDGEKSTYEVKGDVVVIGGGNVAIDVARSAVRCGAGKVSMYCLESRDIMPAADDEVADAEADGITVNCGWGPKEVLTDESGKVKGIVLKRCVKVFDDQHRFNPVYDENDTVTVDCSHVYTSIGQSIVWGDMLKGTAAKTGRGNGILVDSFTYQSDDECIFAGGDVVTGPKFVIDAIAAGHQAAESIHLYVRPYASSLTIGRDKRFFKELGRRCGYHNRQEVLPGCLSHLYGRAGQEGDGPLPLLRGFRGRRGQVHRLRPLHDPLRIRRDPPASHPSRAVEDGSLRGPDEGSGQVRCGKGCEDCHQTEINISHKETGARRGACLF